MKKPETTCREDQVLNLLNDYLRLSMTSEEMKTETGLKKILAAAWKTPIEELHNLGIPKFKIAQMYFRLLQKRDFIHGFIPFRRVDVFYTEYYFM